MISIKKGFTKGSSASFNPPSSRGSEFKYRARPNRLWGRPEGPLGGCGPHLSSPILPWFRPQRRKSLLWPSGAGAPPVPKKSAKRVSKLNQRLAWPGRMPKGPWGPRGPWAEPGFWRFPLCRTGPPRCAPQNAAVRRLRTEGPHAEGREFRPGAFPELTTPMDPPGGHWVDLRRHWLDI